MDGKFITVEGGEGAGKSSNLVYICDYLRMQGREVLMTREPGGTDIGESIRGLLLDRERKEMCVDAELLLVFAARAQHLAQVIRPALQQGKVVLCDRFTDATYAYQGGGRGLPMGRIADLEELVQQGLQPDLTILLDVPVAVGMARAGQRGEPDRFESEQSSFFERVRQQYLCLAAAHPARFRVIDASCSLPLVQEQLQFVLDEFLDETS